MPTRIVFFQGNGASMFQYLIYAGLFGDRKVVFPNNDLPDVVYWPSWNPVLWPIFLINALLNWICNRPYMPIHATRFWHANIGQTNDVAEMCARHRNVSTKEDAILFGVSRGALTTFLGVSHCSKPENIKLVLLEGCPDSIPNAIRYRFGILAPIVSWLLQIFTEYDPDVGERFSPINTVNAFPHNVPVAFVTSKRDEIVSPDGVLKLYDALKESGHPNVHLLVLEDATHNRYYDGSARDRQNYEQFVGGLCKQYNL